MSHSKFIISILVFGAIFFGIYWYFFSNSPLESIQGAVKPVVKTETSTCQIIALGDSITAGYELPPEMGYPAQLEALLQNKWYNCRVINAGVSGDTSKTLLDRIDFSLADTSYTLAILTIGGNDGLRNLPIEDLDANIRESIRKIQAKNIPILLSGMQIPNNAGVYAQKFKEIYPVIAREFKVPLFEFFLEGVAMQEKLNLPDGIHPNEEGYRIITKNLYEFMKQSKILDTLPKK